MRPALALILLTACAAADANDPSHSAAAKLVECSGSTVAVLDNRPYGSAEPFHAVFRWEGDYVAMIEGPTTGFSTSYKHAPEIDGASSIGFSDDTAGSLIFYTSTGRFLIKQIDISLAGQRIKTTEGDCRKFVKNDVFK